MFEINCIINLNKPAGMSSNTAVQQIKHILGAKKVGYLGTLDPLGTGVLPIAINKATKLFDEYLKKKKVYRTVFTFGKETDTLDSEGKIINSDIKIISEEQIKQSIQKFIGKINQLPPKYSAKKINGQKSYELARKGIEVELKPREVEIFRFDLIEKISDNIFLFEIECSAGTYIRSICRDLAYDLSTYGTMLAIIRTRCGIFDIQNSFTIDDIKNNNYNYIEV